MGKGGRLSGAFMQIHRPESAALWRCWVFSHSTRTELSTKQGDNIMLERETIIFIAEKADGWRFMSTCLWIPSKNWSPSNDPH